MDMLSFSSALGLCGLVIGMILVNALSTPRSAFIGTIVAGVGVLMLSAAAVGQLLSRLP